MLRKLTTNKKNEKQLEILKKFINNEENSSELKYNSKKILIELIKQNLDLDLK